MTHILRTGVIVLFLAGCASQVVESPMFSATRGQTVAQQQRDAAECGTWAAQQTGYQPSASVSTTIPEDKSVMETRRRTSGVAGAAAIGATTEVAGGKATSVGTASDAGLGAAHPGFGFTRTTSGYDRALTACMAGRGYEPR